MTLPTVGRDALNHSGGIFHISQDLVLRAGIGIIFNQCLYSLSAFPAFHLSFAGICLLLVGKFLLISQSPIINSSGIALVVGIMLSDPLLKCIARVSCIEAVPSGGIKDVEIAGHKMRKAVIIDSFLSGR